MKPLKPVTFIQGKYRHNSQNTTQQILLVNALKITQDPKKLKEMIGVKTVAEVYRTLDKLAMRKEYHAALAKLGITFDYMVAGIKKEADTAEKSGDRLKAFSTLLKSIGLDKYDDQAIGGGNWEDALLKLNEGRKADKEPKTEIGEYTVVKPEIPESVKKARAKEKSDSSGLYDK